VIPLSFHKSFGAICPVTRPASRVSFRGSVTRSHTPSPQPAFQRASDMAYNRKGLNVVRTLFGCRRCRLKPVKSFDAIDDYRSHPTQHEDTDNHKAQVAKVVIQAADKIPESSGQV
jgi:hypothetical protein